MKRIMAMADRAALLSLKGLVALNLLFLLSFLVILLLAGRAGAETVCSGKDMTVALQKDDPATYGKIEAEAAATLNGEGLLWKLERRGERPSWLFGTMHLTDPRVVTLPAAAQKAFDASGTVVIETTEVLDQARMMAALAKEPELMMFTDGTTLALLLSSKDAALVDKGLAARGISMAAVAKMKPWMLSAMVALPACEMARKAEGAPVLDVKLAQEAKTQGKDLEGVESVADQLHAMASLPISLHMKGLVETLRLGDKADDLSETMVVLYQRGRIGMIWPLLRAVVPDEAGGPDGYAAFEEALVISRNKVMAERALPILKKGDVFMAVGALHLPGPQGLVEQFRKAGYVVTRAD
jgi:uncharacterized protein YbaP (TraB family)